MRILVLGASGYVGSRLVPELLAAGHEVVAASSSVPAPARFVWGDDVAWTQCDVTDPEAVRHAVSDVEAVAYLVHSLDRPGFEDIDRLGATNVADAVAESGVRRLVYLSGLVPTDEHLSRHLASRLEVEEILLGVPCSAASLRAGVVVGAGSTSFEVIRQLAELLVVQPVPTWMHRLVQPVAVSDVLRALVEALADDVVADGSMVGAIDVGGPDLVTYPELMGMCGEALGLTRVRVPALVAPMPVVSLATALLVTAPVRTVAALIESLSHDMVCRRGHTWSPASGEPLMSIADALRRAGDPTTTSAEASLPSDEPWTRVRVPLVDVLPLPATTRAGARLAWLWAGRIGGAVIGGRR